MRPLMSRQNPKFKKRKMKWENTLCVGLEIEVEHSSDGNESRDEALSKVDTALKSYKGRKNPFYYKEDGSLTNGIEFMAQPMTLQYIHNRVGMKFFFDTLLKNNFKNSDKCGIHVHLSKDFFEPLELAKIRLFFSTNQKQLLKLSGRREYDLNKWAKLENYTVRDFLHREKTNTGAAYERMSACTFRSNLKDKTIEMRLFSSTTNHKRFIAIIQFCDAVGYFVKEVGTGAISKPSCWKEFVNWCEQKNRYNHLIEELENANLAS